MLGRGGGGVKTETLNCYQDDSCIKICSDESHFNAVVIVRDKARRQCPQTTICEKSGQPKRNRPEVLLLAIWPPDGFKPLSRKASSPEVQANWSPSEQRTYNTKQDNLDRSLSSFTITHSFIFLLFLLPLPPPPPL